ncbi:hypothetical protein FKM82_026004 [Ascaphus truei]
MTWLGGILTMESLDESRRVEIPVGNPGTFLWSKPPPVDQVLYSSSGNPRIQDRLNLVLLLTLDQKRKWGRRGLRKARTLECWFKQRYMKD